MKQCNACGSCQFFIGAGDFNLCCEKHSWLCYRDSEACELYEYSKEKVRQLEERDEQFAEYLRTHIRHPASCCRRFFDGEKGGHQS